jgi:ABC-2 type transport system permease protein
MTLASEATPAAPAPHRVRPFYWSIRRELWENRAIYLAPLAVAAVVLAGFLYASHGLPQELRTAMSPAAAAHAAPMNAPPPLPPAGVGVPHAGVTVTNSTMTLAQRAEFALIIPYAAAAFAILVTATLVGVFYALGALYGERRDRSVLFWKSLPVSDLTTVLSKTAITLIALPLVAVAVAVATQLLMLAWSAGVVAAAGLHPADLWGRTHLRAIWPITIYGIVTLTIWWAPVAGWLLLVSAWAKRTTFLWAVAPPAAISLFEVIALRSDHVWRLIMSRLHGGGEAFQPLPHGGRFDIDRLQPDPVRFITDPGVWGGLIFLALCVAAAAWLRRRRDPI